MEVQGMRATNECTRCPTKESVCHVVVQTCSNESFPNAANLFVCFIRSDFFRFNQRFEYPEREKDDRRHTFDVIDSTEKASLATINHYIDENRRWVQTVNPWRAAQRSGALEITLKTGGTSNLSAAGRSRAKRQILGLNKKWVEKERETFISHWSRSKSNDRNGCSCRQSSSGKSCFDHEVKENHGQH